MATNEVGCCTEIQVRPIAAECSRIRRIVSCLASHKFRDSAAVNDLELAVGEAFSNAVKYGGEGIISLLVDAGSARELVVEFLYPGASFDTAVTFPEDYSTGNGGFGRYIMREVLDGVDYRFVDGYTHLRLTKRVS